MIQYAIYTLRNKSSIRSIIWALLLLLSISSCEEDKNPCYQTKCNPYQYCFEGTCITIENDSSELGNTRKPPIPKQVLMSNFVLTKLPSTNVAGSSWDPNNGDPDLIIRIEQGRLIVWETAVPIADVGLIPFQVNLDSQLVFNNVKKLTAINIYDDDGSQGQEFMGGLFITPFVENNGYPDTLTSNVNGTIVARFDLEYVFD